VGWAAKTPRRRSPGALAAWQAGSAGSRPHPVARVRQAEDAGSLRRRPSLRHPTAMWSPPSEDAVVVVPGSGAPVCPPAPRLPSQVRPAPAPPGRRRGARSRAASTASIGEVAVWSARRAESREDSTF
jgi:hypothetical protein